MKFKIKKILYFKDRIYYFIMLLFVLPLSHISLKEETQLFLIMELIIFIGFIFDFIFRNSTVEFYKNSFAIYRNVGSIRILKREIAYDTLMFVSINSNYMIGENVYIRYKDFSKRFVVTRESQINFNYFDKNDVIKISKLFLEELDVELRINNKRLTAKEIMEFKNNLSKAT